MKSYTAKRVIVLSDTQMFIPIDAKTTVVTSCLFLQMFSLKFDNFDMFPKPITAHFSNQNLFSLIPDER